MNAKLYKVKGLTEICLCGDSELDDSFLGRNCPEGVFAFDCDRGNACGDLAILVDSEIAEELVKSIEAEGLFTVAETNQHGAPNFCCDGPGNYGDGSNCVRVIPDPDEDCFWVIDKN